MLMDWVIEGITWLLGLFPRWDPFPDFSSTVQSWYDLPVIGDGLEVMSYLDHFVPINEAVQLVGLTVTFLGFYLAWWTFNWIWRALPFT